VTQIHDLTALEQAAAIRRGELTAGGVLEHYLDRVARLDGQIGAFVTMTPGLAAAAAETLPPGDSPLRGVPIGIKDLSPTKGVRTTFGSAAMVDWVPEFDSYVVAAIKAAGMPILGKTATSEFGCALYTETAFGPPTRNPWRLDLTPGGSSGGAAAAVAAGMLPVAHGSDGGGSVRIPAALCGLVGYKSSRGVVPLGPGNFGAFGLPVNGAIGRTVADVAALTVVMARRDPLRVGGGRRPHTPMQGQPDPSAEPYLSPLADPAVLLDLDGPAGPLKIGRFTRPLIADSEVDPACVAAVDAASAALADLGHEIVEVERPFDPDVFDLFLTVWAVLAGWPLPPEAEESLTPLVRWLRGRAAATPALELVGALAGLQARVEIATARLAGVDLTLCPTLTGTRAAVGAFTSAGGPADDFTAQARFSSFCAAFNLIGAPAISLPVGETPDGLPVGAMLAGRPGADHLLLSVAAALEQALPWSHRHPAIWDAGSHS
jgi:amidase